MSLSQLFSITIEAPDLKGDAIISYRKSRILLHGQPGTLTTIFVTEGPEFVAFRPKSKGGYNSIGPETLPSSVASALRDVLKSLAPEGSSFDEVINWVASLRRK